MQSPTGFSCCVTQPYQLVASGRNEYGYTTNHSNEVDLETLLAHRLLNIGKSRLGVRFAVNLQVLQTSQQIALTS